MIVYKNTVAAFIDLDGTLYDGYLWQALFRHHKQFCFKRAALYTFIAFHLPLWLLYRGGLLSKGFFYRTHAANLAWLVRGASVERADTIWKWVIDNEILPRLRPEMQVAIEDHQNQGHRVILMSGSFAPLLDELAIRLGVERAIATPLAVKNGHYTGKVIPPLNIGQGKVERLKQFLAGSGKEIDLATSYFYTDAIVDAPALKMFGYPVAVYPDPELTSLATARGWPVIGGNHKVNVK
jgi:HAD superfamily hydrolase (TIGR01490 family)